jgi:CHC2-type zinc finger protein
LDTPNVARTGRFRKDLLPPGKTFFDREIGKLSRANSKGWSLGRCPFHESKSGRSFSVNIVTGAWICFGGCGKGSLIDFVMKRDMVDFKTACRTLGCWDDDGLRIDAVVIRQIETERQRREQSRQAEQELERRYYEAEDCLYAIEAIYRSTNDRLSGIRRGHLNPDEEETCWSILSLALDEVRAAEEQFIRLRCAWPGAPFNEKARNYKLGIL